MTGIGRRRWAVPGGEVPVDSTGPEPELTSHDRVSVLNAGDEPAEITIEVIHADREAVGPYRLTVAARRVRAFRINDLIDPEAVPLGVPHGLLLRSDRPVIVQFTRLDSGSARRATCSTIAFPAPD